MQEHPHEYLEHVFHVPTQLDQRLGIWVRSAGHNVAKPHYHVGPRMLNYYSFHIVKKGCLWVKNGSSQYELKQGDLFCMVPGNSYEYGIVHPSGPEPLCLQWIAVDGVNAETLITKQIGFTTALPVIRCVSEDLLRRFQDIFTKLQQRSNRTTLPLLSLLMAVMTQLEQHRGQSASPLDRSHSDATHAEQQHPSWLQKSLLFMEMHYKENLSVAQVADWIGVSRTHFSQYFTKLKGISPSRYIEKLRIQEAKQLLHKKQLSITEIAYSVGYHDLYSFSRAFKRHTGWTPSEFRVQEANTQKASN